MPANPPFEAGRADRRIKIQVLGPSVDNGLRVEEGDWLDVGDRWAWLMPLSGSERIAAGENAAFQTQKFRIRRPRTFMPGTKTHRLLYRGTAYDISEVQEIGRDQIDLIAIGRPDVTTG